MRNISFALTTEQIKNRTKTVTRRLGWKNLKPGTLLCACKKCMGLKPGEKIEKLCVIRVVDVRLERLDAITRPRIFGMKDVRAEGFPTMSTQEFVDMFCHHMGCTPETIVTRIEFEYV